MLTDLSSRICHSGHVKHVQIKHKALTPSINSGVFKSGKIVLKGGLTLLIDFCKVFYSYYSFSNAFMVRTSLPVYFPHDYFFRLINNPF